MLCTRRYYAPMLATPREWPITALPVPLQKTEHFWCWHQQPVAKIVHCGDGQKSGLAGESFFAAELLKSGLLPPDYYIVPGCDLRSDPDKFGKWFADYKKMPGIHPKAHAEYRNNWKVFDS